MSTLAQIANRRKRCFRNIASATLIGFALFALILLAALDTQWSMPKPARWVLFATGLGILFFMGQKWWRRARRERTPLEAARVIESSQLAIGQKLRTAHELKEHGLPAAAGEHAETFARQITSESDMVLAEQNWRKLVPRGKLWRNLGVATLLGLTLLTLLSVWPDFRLGLARVLAPSLDRTYTHLEWNLPPSRFDERHPPRLELTVGRRLAEPTLYVRLSGESAWQAVPLSARDDGQVWDTVLTGMTANFEAYATAGDARTETIDVQYKPIPKLIEAEVVVTYPDYIGREQETLPGGDVSALEGSQARWNFGFNTQPDRILWSLDGGKREVLKADSENRTSVSWTLPVGKFNGTLTVADNSGEVIDSWRFEAIGLLDKMPKIQIIEPAKDMEATSVTEIPVRIRAKDDYGVSEIGLVLEAAGETDWVLEQVVDASNQRQIDEMVSAMLEKVPLTMRDNVRMHAYALDHKARGGPRAVSALRSIDIRQFKKRWMYLGGGGGGPEGEGMDMEQIGEKIVQLNELISAQRGVVSDTFVLKGGHGVNAPAPPDESRALGAREMQVGSDAKLMEGQWNADGQLAADDLALLDIAGTQMLESATWLNKLDLKHGFDSADNGLRNLLQLRKRLLTIIMKGKKGQKPSESLPKNLDFASLIAEAERLAREEADVRSQLTPEEGVVTKPEITQRQQEVAVADGGELYAKLIAHPERTDGAMQLMDEAEVAMVEADKLLRTDEPTDSSDSLALAEQRLTELADFLRALELEQLAETMRKLAEKADKDAKDLAEAEKKDAEGQKENEDAKEGKKPGEGEGESKAVAEAKGKGKGEGEGKGEGKGKGEGEGKGKGEGEGASEVAENAARDAAEKAARDAAMVDEILKELAKRAGQDPSRSPGEEPGEGENQAQNDRPGAADLEKLREKLGAGSLAAELKELTRKPGEGRGAGELAGRLGKMADEMRKYAAQLDASRLAKLAEAKKEAEELRAAIEEKEKQKAAELAQRRAADPFAAIPNLIEPSALPAQLLARKGEGKGKGEGEGEGKGEGKGEGETKGEGQEGDPDDKDGKGGSALLAERKANSAGGGGPTVERFVDALESVGDNQLDYWALRIRPRAFDRSTIPLIEAAEDQIDKMIVEMPKNSREVDVRGSVPDKRRREIEDYYRSLSDDFGGEVWEDR